MANQDWSNLGNEIKNLVQTAIDSQDFKRLNETIGKTINDAMENVNQGLAHAGDKLNEAGEKLNHAGRHYEKRYRSERPQNPWDSKRAVSKNVVAGPRLYKSTVGMTGAGMALSITGYLAAGGLGIGALAVFLVGMVTGMGPGQTIALGILLPLLIGSAFMAGAGTRILGRVKRFKTYMRGLKGREYCSIKELAQNIGKSESYVLKDVRDMLKRNMFLQGHLDRQLTCLMVTDEIYKQYQMTQAQVEAQQRKPEKIEETPSGEDSNQLPEEVRRVIQEGNAYIQEIRRSNEAIPGEEISAKITRMELITRKIFNRVEQRPELVSDLHKFMGYYLPTTVKLLNAYQELDSQPVQGPNILSSKQEIEGTLDTINQAFENLLDSFFQDTAWDISSDISVLQTMLAQEGLTNSDFTQNK